MPIYEPVAFFSIANVHGPTARTFLVPQINACITRVQADSAGEEGGDGYLLLDTAPGTEPALQNAHLAFRLQFVANEPLNFKRCELTFHRAGFDLLPISQKAALVEAFVTGTDDFQIRVSVAGAADDHLLTVHLRAVKTGDYVVHPATAPATGMRGMPAHHPNITGNNLPEGLGTFSYACAALGGPLTVSNDQFELPPSATPPATNDPAVLVIGGTLPGADPVSVNSELPIDLYLPTEVIATVDRSGSMTLRTTPEPTSPTRWQAARMAANLFANLYGKSLPPRSVPHIGAGDQTLASLMQIKLCAFDWTGTTLRAFYYPDGPGFATAEGAPPEIAAASPGSLTPIGAALVDGYSHFDVTAAAAQWRRRHMLLLTDGKNNRGTPTLADLIMASGAHAQLPSTGASASEGVIVHSIGYGPETDVPVGDLQTLSDSHYGGRFLASDSETGAADLCTYFINVLHSILPMQAAGPFSFAADGGGASAEILVEEGVERVIFIALHPDNHPIAASLGGASHTGAEQGGGLSWAWVDNPAPGAWVVSGPIELDEAPVFAVFDVALRMQCDVESEGLGKPIRVLASLRHDGVPVRGAEVRVVLRRPAESAGEVTAGYVRQHGLGAVAKHAGLRDFSNVARDAQRASATTAGRLLGLRASQVAAGIPTPQGDTVAIRHVLRTAAEQARQLPLQTTASSIVLTETAPGRYEAEIAGTHTEEAGIYAFSFHAAGTSPAGHAFQRSQKRSLVLTPLPSADASEVSFVRAPASAGKVAWTVTVAPKTVTGRLLGPALGDVVAFRSKQAKATEVETYDNLDGTYSTQLVLDEKVAFPPLTFGFDRPNIPPRSLLDIVPKKAIRRVKLTLDKVHILDAKDPCWAKPGEIAFFSIIAPNGCAAAAVSRRIPAKGQLRIATGQRVDLDEVLYEGWVEEGAILSVTLGAKEFDWFLFFRRKQHFARYHRLLEVTPGKHVFRPDDEPDDAESLHDWKLWYTVEVE